MQRSSASKTQNTFLEALRSEIAAGNENLSSWVKYIHSQGKIDVLFELETWLKASRSFLNIEHLPLADEEKEELLERSFLSEINIVRQAIQICENHAYAVMSIGEEATFDIDAIIEKQSRKERILDSHIGRFLEQMTPIDSISKLLDSLNDLRISIDAFQNTPHPGYQLYLALGRNYRQELKSCRYIDMLLNQRFRIQYDLIENRSLTEVLRSIPDEQLRRNTALALLYLFRIMKYLKMVQEDLLRDRSLRHHLVIFSLIHEEMGNVSTFLKKHFLKGKNTGQKLQNAADMAAYSLKTESRRVLSKELVFLSKETDPTKIYTGMENSHGILKNCCQNNILSIVSVIDKEFHEEELFPGRVERIAEADNIRRNLWDLRKWLMTIIDNENTLDTNKIIERLTNFKDTFPLSLMYRDWVEFENFIDILTISNDSNDVLTQTRRFLDFIEDLIQEVSKRGIYQKNIKI